MSIEDLLLLKRLSYLLVLKPFGNSCSSISVLDVQVIDCLIRKIPFAREQILSRAIGGKVSRAESWDIGLRTVQLSSTSKPFSSLNLPTLLSIIECHRDEVHFSDFSVLFSAFLIAFTSG